ncbi:hypothetical protein SH1V18_28200 [Vallitalea longa]|uniref:Uncharacterized protein n=1 Tax=Vallitalea longa TaxID=2936439 RepID=A0A9W5YAG1_9FIRM|nr:hypothetical protein [Vallitalea longa]GKX30340.1 hypothetical protein SH1V18_28200 [Vallitalea longa]
MKLNKKQKYYLGTYLFGYAISVLESGVPSIIYLIPIKLFGFMFSITMGKGLYLVDERKMPLNSIKFSVGIKSTFIVLLLVVVTCILKGALLLNGIDISFITAPL